MRGAAAKSSKHLEGDGAETVVMCGPRPYERPRSRLTFCFTAIFCCSLRALAWSAAACLSRSSCCRASGSSRFHTLGAPGLSFNRTPRFIRSSSRTLHQTAEGHWSRMREWVWQGMQVADQTELDLQGHACAQPITSALRTLHRTSFRAGASRRGGGCSMPWSFGFSTCPVHRT